MIEHDSPAGALAAATLAEQASLLSGADMAGTVALERLGLPSVVMTDGPHGLAMNLPGFRGKVEAVAFPTAANLAATWNTELVQSVGRAIGAAASRAGADVLLGPGLNIKRSPLGGRNFEYYSEDPLVSGQMGAAFVRGVQQTGVAACPKHFAVNNQETDRMRVSAEVSERALREIYLSGFEQVVVQARPRAMMASYNRINGVYASEDPWLLTRVLRDEWGFDGAVISDWGAVDDRLAALVAGLDLEMPGTGGASADAIVDAVHSGLVDAETVRASAERVAALVHGPRSESRTETAGGDDALALEAAQQSIVLLRNDGVLPLEPPVPVVVIGALAEHPPIQGGGSSQVNDRSAENLLGALSRRGMAVTRFAAGYTIGESGTTPELLAEASEAVTGAAVVIAVVGLDGDADSEGRDRLDLRLPRAQQAMLDAAAANSSARVVTVCFGGGVMTVDDFAADSAALLWAGLPGRHGATALADIITGRFNPSAKLTETIPSTLASTPSFLSFPGEAGRSFYGEGVFVGYRGYDARDEPVAYPFGHGLGYSPFSYAQLDVHTDPVSGGVTVEFAVTNDGRRPGTEIAQVYVGQPDAGVPRIRRQLAGFVHSTLQPGEARTLAVDLPLRAFQRWDERSGGWRRDQGSHRIEVGASSRDLRLGASVVLGEAGPFAPLTVRSTLREWMTHPVAAPTLRARLADLPGAEGTLGLLSNEHVLVMIGDLPIERLTVDRGNALTVALLEQVAAGIR
ncbi:glycoside hydrolase family 3 protein [Herbiconiux sp.]|uniref:glycoside hydrolase family 3 protein n=1 Tax=Herbiconiux sp. TaxID=1871186 RepID=UPI0025C7240B|nr:glycoside hydrolase family 3 protein [Herbiconiux sp.]